MKKKSRISLYLIVLLTMVAFSIITVMAAPRFSVATGNWNSTTVWSATSGGAPGAAVPVAGDVVTIEGGFTVTVNANTAALGSLTISTGSVLTVGGFTITVTGATIVTGTINFNNAAGAKTFTGDVTLNGGAVWNETAAAVMTFSGSLTNNATTFTASTGLHTFSAAAGGTISGTTAIVIPSVTFTTSYTNSGTLTCATILNVTGVAAVLTNNGTINATTALSSTGGVTNSATGVLNIGGTSTITTLTATAVGNTVNFNGGAAQAACKVTTYHNLTLSGALAKTFATSPTVNGILSLEGTASVIVTGAPVVTYGPNATLQYNKPALYTATAEEWISPFAATGGVIITNTGAITMGAAKIFNADVPLTINTGATLTPGANLLTLGGNFTISGTGAFTSGTGGVTITGTATTQSISGFTTTGNVSMTKASGIATISGAVSAVNLTVNGAVGTLVLSGSNTFSGTRTITAGTLILGNTAALGAAGTAIALNGGTLDLMTDASVNAYNVTVGGAATITSDRATSGVGITHLLGTLSIGAFTLGVTTGTNVASGTAGLTLGTTTLTGAAVFNVSSANANLTLGAVGGAFAMTKQGAGQMTLATTSTRATAAGTTTLTAGILRLNIANALNTLATAPLALNGGTLSLGVTAGATYGGTATTVGGAATIESDRLTAGAGVTQTLGTLSIGNFILSINGGSNVTSGTAGITFGAVTHTAAPTYTVTNPVGGGVTQLSLGAIGNANFLITMNGNGNVIQTGVFGTNTAGLTYSGTGTLTLSRTNTFTGPTTISSGTIRLGSATSIANTSALIVNGTFDMAGFSETVGSIAGSASGIVTSSAAGAITLTAGGDNTNTTYSGIIQNGSSTLALAKAGNGIFTLSGSNTYTGLTTLTAGTLALANTAASGPAGNAITLNGGTLDLMTDASVNAYNITVGGAGTISSDLATSGAGITHTLGTLSIGAFTLGVNAGTNVASGTAGVTFGTTTLTGAAIFNVSSANANLTLGAVGGAFGMTKQGTGQMTLATASTRVTAAGTTTLTAGTLRLNIANALNTLATAPLALNGGTLSLGVTAGATYGGTATTVGGAATVESDLLAPGAGVSQILNTLSIGAFTLGVTAGTNVTSGTAGVTFGTTTLTGAAIFNVSSANANLTLGAVGGAFRLTKQGAGQMTLATTSTRTTAAGATTLTAGTLRLNIANALNTLATAPLALNGGTLSLGVTAGATYGGTATTVGGAATVESDLLTPGAGAIQTLGTLSIGAFTLTIAGGSNVTGGTAGVTFGAVTHTAAPTYTVNNPVGGGVTQLSLGAVGNANNLITFNGSGNVIQTGVFGTNTAGLTYSGTGTLTLNQANTFSGVLTVSGGTVVGTANAAALGAGTLTLSGGVLRLTNASGTNLNFARNTTVSGNAQITSDVNVASTAGNTYTLGTLSINASTLTIAGGSNVTGGTAGVTFGAVTHTAAPTYTVNNPVGGGVTQLSLGAVGNANNLITFNGSGNVIQTGVFGTNTAGLTYSGTGTLTLNQANTFSGVLTVSGGTVVGTANAAALGAGTLTLSGGVLRLTNASGTNLNFARNTTVSGNAQITSDVNVASTAGNTYTLGTLSINASTLTIAGGSNVASGTAGVTFGATTFTGAPTFTVNNPAGGGTTQMSVPAVNPGGFNAIINGNGNVIQTGIWGATAGGITYSGTGILTLNQVNTFTGGVTLNSGTLNINNPNALGTNAGMFTIAGGTINSSTGAIATIDYPLALNGDFTFTGTNALNLGVGAVSMNSNSQITVSASTLTIGGAITGASYSLIKAGTGTLSFGANAVTLNGLTIINAGTLTATSGTTNLAGNFSNSGTFAANGGTFNFNGGSAQTIGGAGLTFNNLTINNASGVTLNAPASIAGTLTLTSGTLTTSATNLLTITNTAVGSITGGSATSYINGPLAITLLPGISADGTTYLFPVGENGYYRPLELVNIRTGASPVVTVTLNGTGAVTSDETTITSIAPRNWYVQTTGGVFTSAFVRLTESGLVQTRVMGTSSAQAGNYSSLGGSNIGSSITSAVTVSSLPAYFAIGTSLVQGLYSYLSGDWDVANSWTTDASGNTRVNPRVPGPLDNVTILNGRTITIGANTKQVNSLTMIAGSILDIGLTTGHNLGTVAGQGTIKLSSNAFPGGTFTNFVASNGGTIEYYNLNNSSITTTQFTYNNLIVSNNSASTNSAFLINSSNPTNYIINGNLSLKNYSTGSHTLYFGDPTASDNLINMTVYGNLSVDAGCNIKVNNFAGVHTIPNVSDEGATAYPVHTLSIYGNLTNNGTVRFTGLPSPLNNAYYLLTTTASPLGGTNYGDVQVIFNGATNNTVTCNGVTDFFRIVVAKGTDKTYTLEVNSSSTNNFTLYAPNNQGNGVFDTPPAGFGHGAYYKALFIHYGTLKLNENITIPSLTEGGQDFNIIPTAGLWINGATVSTTLSGVNGTGYQAATCYGTLRISAGQFSTGDAAGFVLGTLGNPALQIEGTGILDVSQAWSTTGASNQMSYTQTGGTANFRLQGEEHPGQMLSLNNINSTFTMSGGSINFTNSTFINATPNYDVLDIQSQAGNFSVTGGTVNLNLPSSATQIYTANSTVPFYNLNISRRTGTATTTVRWNTSLNVLHDLSIGDNSTLDLNANVLDLTVGRDFTISSLGTYTPAAGRTTIFNGAGAQAFNNTGTITGNLRNLTLTNTADVTFSGNNNTITGNLTIGHGTALRDNGTTIFVQGNIVNSGTHFKPATGAGSIELNGTAAQTISGDGTGSFNNLTLNKATGTTTMTANFTITGELRLANTAARLNIGSNLLALGASADVYDAVSPGTTQIFSAARMVYTSGLLSDGGVSKVYSNTTAFNFPFGFYNTANTTYYYMPHSIQVSGATGFGTITTRPVNGRHPLAQGSANALTCYWKTTSTGFTGVTSVVNNYYYDAALSKDFVVGAEASYQNGVYNNATWNTSTGGVNTTTNQVSYTTSTIDGEYTAGETTAFGVIPSLYSVANGDWSSSTTWNTQRDGLGIPGTPSGSTLVVICNDWTVTTTAPASSSSITIEAGSTLDLASAVGHNFGSIAASSGTLKIASTNYFPSGDWSNFLGASGGTVEYYTLTGNIIIPTTTGTYRNLILTHSSNYSITHPDCDLTIYGDLTIAGSGTGSVITRTTGTSRTYTINGNLNINSGVLEFGNGVISTIKVLGNTNIASGSTFRAASTGTVVNNVVELYGNLTCAGTGIFNMNNTGIAYTYFKGAINAVISNGTGTIGFYNLFVDKGTDITSVLTVTANSVTTGVSPFLILSNGTFRLNNSSLNIPISTTTAFTIPSTACLSVQAGTATIGTTNDNGDLLLQGKLEILGGTVNIGNGGAYNNDIEYAPAGTPQIDIQSGQLNVTGQLRRSTGVPSGSLTYSQSGGTVTTLGNNPNTSRALFEVVNSGIFTMSNGTIIIANHITAASPYDLYLNPGIENITGGTIQFGLSGVTPASTLFYFQSGCSIGNITLEATTNSSAIQEVYPLTLVGNLTIGGSTSYYNTNGLDVTIGGNLTNNNTSASTGLTVGGYRTQVLTQSTGFVGSTNQTLTGTSSNLTNFANLDIATAAGYSLFLSGGNIIINSNLTLSSGTLNDGGNTINLLKNVDNNATHYSPTTSGGMIFNGAINQGMTGIGGVFGNIEINNSGQGVNMTDNATINSQLKLTNGYIYIDNNALTLGQTAAVSGADGTNHIILNGVSGDAGVTKIFPTGASSFTFPIGDNGKYTPCTFNFASNDNAAGGTIKVVPVDALHPTVDPALLNYLSYYWKVTTTGLLSSPFSVTQTYTYIPADTTGNPANIERCDNSTSAWTTVTPGTITPPTFSFSSTTLLDGSYTIGDVFGSLPVLQSAGSGDWFVASTWTPAFVPNGHSVVIQSGHTVTLTTDGAVASSVDVEGVLDAQSTISHTLGSISGGGKIRLSASGASFVFPGGTYDAFLANSTSIVEYYGTTNSTMPLTPGDVNKPYQHLLFTGSGIKYVSAVDIKINSTLTISDGSRLDNTLYNKNLILLGNWIDQNTSTAGFTAGTGIVRFNGTSAQSILMATNSMKETFYNLEINNSAGLTLNTGTVDVSNQLMLTLGNINFTSITNNILTITNTGTNAIVGGSVNSFVNGPLSKRITNGSSFQFPVGDAVSSSRNRIGYVSVTNTATTGTQTWTARFFDKNPTTDTYDISLVTPPLISAVNNEYWNVIGPTGGSAKVVLSWDQYTGMSSDPAVRASSAVAEWNTPTATSWNSAGGVVADGGQNSGTVTTSALVNLEDHIFTIGAKANLFTAVISGNWNDPNTWGSPFVPSATDAVEIGAGTVVTLNTAGVVIAKLTVDNGATFDIGNFTMSLTGNLDLKSGSTWTGSGGKISMTGSTGTIFGSGAITGTNTLEIAGNKNIDASANLTLTTVSILTGNTLSNNGTVTINSFSSDGTFVNSSGSTLNFTGANLGTITLTADACSNTVNYSGSISQTIKAVNYCNLAVSSTGAKILNDGANITVNGDITQQSGTPFTIGTTVGAVTIQIVGGLITGDGFVNNGDITVGN